MMPYSHMNSAYAQWRRLRKEVLGQYGHKCNDCGSSENLELHHIIPRSKGGPTESQNLMPLCPGCHLKRHAKPKPVRPGVIVLYGPAYYHIGLSSGA